LLPEQHDDPRQDRFPGPDTERFSLPARVPVPGDHRLAQRRSNSVCVHRIAEVQRRVHSCAVGFGVVALSGLTAPPAVPEPEPVAPEAAPEEPPVPAAPPAAPPDPPPAPPPD